MLPSRFCVKNHPNTPSLPVGGVADKGEFDELKDTFVIFHHSTKTHNKSNNNTNNQKSGSD